MIKKIWTWIFKKNVVAEMPAEITIDKKPRGVFSTQDLPRQYTTDRLQEVWKQNFSKSLIPFNSVRSKSATDANAMDNFSGIKTQYNGNGIVPDALLLWYGSQTFIGYQLCALMSQHWLISKVCLMPAKDATRNGFEITVNDGTDVSSEILDAIRKADVKYRLNHNLVQFIQMGRVFGIRIAMFIIDNVDPEFYKKPFNIDGVKPGSYRGISQIDPYWITPQLDGDAAGNPAAINFYEPTWWNVNGRLIHRSHLIIYKTEEVPDILKPTYIYGGIPIPQKIYERVYAAERTANEAPMLALTKRTDVVKADLGQAVANEIDFDTRMQQWVRNRDNYGVKMLGLEEEMEQFDTSLTDLDAVIMTQFQIVAAAGNVPATKLLGTSPKGFNATGEFEFSSYHEELESIQEHDCTPLVERHHLLLIKSEIAPKFGIEPLETTISWNPLDAMTAEQQANVNKSKAETGQVLIQSGAIDGIDERQRIIADPLSGYAGLVDEETGELTTEEISSNPTEA